MKPGPKPRPAEERLVTDRLKVAKWRAAKLADGFVDRRIIIPRGTAEKAKLLVGTFGLPSLAALIERLIDEAFERNIV